MLLKVKRMFNKKNIKKLLRSTLCVLLSVLTVICFSNVLTPAQAIACVDDAIILFLGAFLVCCGMTFASTSAATNAAQQFYAKAPPSVQEVIDYQAEQLQTDTALQLCFIEVLKSDWKVLIDEFMAQFPQYCNIDLDYTSVVKNQLTENTLFKTLEAGSVVTLSVPCTVDTNIFIQTSANTTLTIAGIDTLKNIIGSDLYNKMFEHNSYFKGFNYPQFAVFNIQALDFTVISLISSGLSDSALLRNLEYSYGDILFNSVGITHNFGSYSLAIYKNVICDYSFSSSLQSYTFTAQSYGNVVSRWISDDVISRNDNLINCDNLCLPMNNIGQLLLGEDVFDVGIDSAHIPGIDSFPSTAGDITDVNTYPDSIGISVPRDLSDTITKTAEDVRTTDKDKTDTKDDTKDNTDSKPNAPSIPSLSLPEILFKEKFPFCLPWDLYNLFVGLQAEAEAPRFVVPFRFERLGIDEEIVIDFSEYEEQIKIIRFFTGAMFVLALIMISRRMVGAE